MSKWIPSDRERSILEKLAAAAAPNAAEFARTFTNYSESMLSKILAAIDPERTRSYFDEIKTAEARAGLMEDLEELLAKLPALRLENERVGNLKLRAIEPFLAVAKAVRGCRNKLSPERLVKVIGPTGAGKTTLRNYLAVEFRGELKMAAVESRDAWRPASQNFRQRCKLVVLVDLCNALGISAGEYNRCGAVPELEDLLIEFLTVHRRLLFIDEGEFFSSYALNLLKLLLNKTRVIIVLACTPRAHAKWNTWYADEADQISRRTDAVVSLEVLAPKDVDLFFEPDAFADRTACLEYLATQGSRFGHFSLIARTARLLEKYPHAEARQVQACLDKALRQMNKQRAA